LFKQQCHRLILNFPIIHSFHHSFLHSFNPSIIPSFIPSITQSMKINRLRLTLLLLLFGLGLEQHSLWAQQTGSLDELQPVTRTLALKNVTLIPAPGQQVSGATLVIKDGLIKAAGQDVQIPAGARILPADSMFVYAGFIEGLSHTGIPKEDEDRSATRSRESARERAQINPANPPYERAGIQPDRGVRELLDPSDKSLSSMRKLGFTAAHVIPRGQMLPGQGSLILLKGKDAREMILMENISQSASFQGARRVYPATPMAVMAKFRQLYRQAELAQQHQAHFSEAPGGMARPTYDQVISALFPLLNQQQPLFFLTENAQETWRAFQLQQELGFSMVPANLKEGWELVEKLKDQGTPVCLSLDLPDADKVKEVTIDEEASELTRELQKEQQALIARQKESIKQHQAQAATLAKAGVAFSLATLDLKAKDFRDHLRAMMAQGLSEDQALAAFTTAPAKMLGAEKVLGTVEPGKIANLVVSDKPYFGEEKANVRMVLVEGEVFEFEVKKKRKGDANVKVEVLGKWSYLAEIPGRETEGTLIIEGEPGSYSGRLERENGSVELQQVTVDGNILSFSYSVSGGGRTYDIEVEVEIEGDTFEGTYSVGTFGSFPMSGERIGGPE
jgi:imidazolonepropionase-like amidohydrolase